MIPNTSNLLRLWSKHSFIIVSENCIIGKDEREKAFTIINY